MEAPLRYSGPGVYCGTLRRAMSDVIKCNVTVVHYIGSHGKVYNDFDSTVLSCRCHLCLSPGILRAISQHFRTRDGASRRYRDTRNYRNVKRAIY